MSDRVMGTILVAIAIAFAAYKLWKLFRKLYCDIKFKSEKTGDAVSAEQYMDELTKQDEQEKPKEEQQDAKDQPEQRKQPQDGDSGEQGGSQGGESDPKGTPKEEGGQKEQPKPENVGGKESPKEGGSPGQPGSDGTPQGASQDQEGPQQGQEGQDGNPAGQGSGTQEQGGSGGSDAEEGEQALTAAWQSVVESGILTKQEVNSLLHELEGDNPPEEGSEQKDEAPDKQDTQAQHSDMPGGEADKKPKTDEELLQQALKTCGMTEDDIKEGRGDENPTPHEASQTNQESSEMDCKSPEPPTSTSNCSANTSAEQTSCSSKACDDPKETSVDCTKLSAEAKLVDDENFDDRAAMDAIVFITSFSLDDIDTPVVTIEGEALTLRELILYVSLCKSCRGEAELYMSRKLAYYIQMCDGYRVPRIYDALAKKLQEFPKDFRMKMIKEPGRLHEFVSSK